MLSQFSFTNYKSFKSEAFLDMAAESIRDNATSIITDEKDGEKFLPVVVIYGPNGGGKSTVLEALGYVRTFVLQTIVISQMHENAPQIDAMIKKLPSFDTKDKHHRFDPICKEQPTRFNIMFRTVGKQYKYELSILHHEIEEENLYMRVVGEEDGEVLFERSKDACVLGELLEGISVDKIKSTMPLISHIAINYDIDEVDEAINWFMSINFVDYDNPQKERRIMIPNTKEEQAKMFAMLQEMDIHISDLRVEKDMDGNILEIYTRHKLDHGESYEIRFEEESSGTRKLFSCLAEIIDCLDEGTLMVADELDAKLHPKLLRYIIERFTNPKTNPNGAQLLLTSHDITTMTSKVYRRDEIWFCARNPQEASKLYSLISFKKENGQLPKNDEVFGKQYLEGRYGADPYIRRILDWGNDE